MWEQQIVVLKSDGMIKDGGMKPCEVTVCWQSILLCDSSFVLAFSHKKPCYGATGLIINM